MSTYRPCPCGSGEPSWWMNDAKGIPLARVCDKCEDKKRATYNPAVFDGSRYDKEIEEQVEDDY